MRSLLSTVINNSHTRMRRMRVKQHSMELVYAATRMCNQDMRVIALHHVAGLRSMIPDLIDETVPLLRRVE